MLGYGEAPKWQVWVYIYTQAMEDLSRLLFELRAREGTALVIVTHDRSLAARADRTLLLGDGRLAPVAPAEEGRAS